MSKARLVITAVVLEGRSPSEVARTYGVARSWVYTLVARYRTEGDTAFEPRSRRPTTRPDATPNETVELVSSAHTNTTGVPAIGRSRTSTRRHRPTILVMGR
ncbi:MAG: helix-turn-helix domain-containing protein [Ilumatobacteraceae bacterium]